MKKRPHILLQLPASRVAAEAQLDRHLVSMGIVSSIRAMGKLGGMLAFSALLAGCVISVDHVVPESEATLDPRLLGRWAEVSGPDRAVISRAAGRDYALEYSSSDGNVSRFGARLGRQGEYAVLDVWPVPGEADLAVSYRDLLIGGHVLLALDIGADEIRGTLLEPDSMLAALRSGELRLAHSSSRDRLVLQGTTEQLRSALGPYLGRTGALGKPSVWRRVPSTESEAAIRTPPAAAMPRFEASPWPEADLLFHRDPHWAGADGAYSVDLGNGRTLWLFGDTWIDPSGRHSRRGAQMIGNSVAIQTGSDPSRAAMAFYWGKTADGRPASFFGEQDGQRFWPGQGVRLRDRLVLFLERVRSSSGGLGFESAGWKAVMVDNPDDEPSRWRVTQLETPANPLGVNVAGVLNWDGHVYAFGSQEPVKSHPIYVVRWPVQEVRRGNLRAPEWWAGADLGWVADSSSTPRWPAFEDGQSELTVHYDDLARTFLAVQTVGFGAADLAIRAAPELTGPWTEPRTLYRPSEFYRPNIMIYAAKAHPALTGADLVLTYATNTFQFSEAISDSLNYYPRFVRLQRCR